ncbi:MAG: MarR family transcriptional regulator [Planctomycetota bacterium]
MASSDRRTRLAREVGKRSPFDLVEEEAFLTVARTYEHLVSPFQALFRCHGLSLSLYNALRTIVGEGEDGLPIGEIARRMIFREPDITRLVQKLESAGLVQRTRSAEDGRVVLIAPTPQGQRKIRELSEPVRKELQDLLGHVPPPDLHRLIDLLEQARGEAPE